MDEKPSYSEREMALLKDPRYAMQYLDAMYNRNAIDQTIEAAMFRRALYKVAQAQGLLVAPRRRGPKPREAS